MKISKKKETELYDLVHKEVMDARIRINMKLKGVVHVSIKDEVDNVLSDLTKTAPLNAIKLFNKNAL